MVDYKKKFEEKFNNLEYQLCVLKEVEEEQSKERESAKIKNKNI